MHILRTHPLTYCGPWYIVYRLVPTRRLPATMLFTPVTGYAAPLGVYPFAFAARAYESRVSQSDIFSTNDSATAGSPLSASHGNGRELEWRRRPRTGPDAPTACATVIRRTKTLATDVARRKCTKERAAASRGRCYRMFVLLITSRSRGKGKQR